MVLTHVAVRTGGLGTRGFTRDAWRYFVLLCISLIWAGEEAMGRRDEGSGFVERRGVYGGNGVGGRDRFGAQEQEGEAQGSVW